MVETAAPMPAANAGGDGFADAGEHGLSSVGVVRSWGLAEWAGSTGAGGSGFRELGVEFVEQGAGSSEIDDQGATLGADDREFGGAVA
jgi:hypothetical protein